LTSTGFNPPCSYLYRKCINHIHPSLLSSFTLPLPKNPPLNMSCFTFLSEGFVLGQSFQSILARKAQQNRAAYIMAARKQRTWIAEMLVCSFSPFVLLTFSNSHPPLLKPLWKHLQRYPQWALLIIYMSLNPIRLIIKINHHKYHVFCIYMYICIL
jgi:lysylphosphatidylglycerol synthetase-like protein (DUF2156 family)